jgi:prepilin-type N-terminal cleavage/methylation domain-containing protein
MIKVNTKQAGFTLIELLLYVSIVGTLLMSVTLFFVTTTNSLVKNQTVSEVDQQGQYAMELITQTIRNANSITLPTAGSAASASLTLVVPTGSLSPTVFNLDGSNALQIKEGTAAELPLTNSKVQISNLQFTNLTRSSTPGIVQVSFTVSRVNSTGKSEYSYQKTFTSSAALRWP